MKVLLFDMDGVLLEPAGYHRALQETVAQVGQLLGYGRVQLDAQDITAFEAAGVASEWDSAAICAALLLVNLWPVHPALRLPVAVGAPVIAPHATPPPDFRPFIGALARPDLRDMPPLRRAEVLLCTSGTLNGDQRRALEKILRTARQMDGSLTHRLFQELVLGSRTFAETYDLAPALDVESFLSRYDRPTLSPSTGDRLARWLEAPQHRAAIFTGRPSRAPARRAGAPEAEIGARRAGVESLPIVGLGGLGWLADRRGCEPEALLKPSPVHTLAALRRAGGDTLVNALEASAALAIEGQADAFWATLRRAQVYVFEDTVPGLRSIVAARDLLAQAGVPIQTRLFGVAARAEKRQALEAAGAAVTPDLAAALRRVFTSGGFLNPTPLRFGD
jgi:beta-phosphoglucomutase-like phosphatase (HAD superfamily)